ncbi:MAG: hypothetical protein AB1758_14710 [Candidatus Eremiobacterota bacterium]
MQLTVTASAAYPMKGQTATRPEPRSRASPLELDEGPPGAGEVLLASGAAGAAGGFGLWAGANYALLPALCEDASCLLRSHGVELLRDSLVAGVWGAIPGAVAGAAVGYATARLLDKSARMHHVIPAALIGGAVGALVGGLVMLGTGL